MGKSFLQRHHAKEYAASWKNPLFSDPKVRDRAYERSRFVLYTLLVLISVNACGSLAFWIGTQNQFSLTDIQVTGMRSAPNEQLALDTWNALLGCKRLGAPCLYAWNEHAADIAEFLQKTYPLEHIEINRNEHTLNITVREAVTLIPLKVENTVWFATQTGVLQSEATANEIAAGILIPPESYSEINVTAALTGDETITAGTQLLSPEVFSQIAAYRKAFLEKGMAITSFEMTDDAGKIIAHAALGFAIYFTPWQDPELQVRRMNDVLQQTTPQRYIDIRFGERIYVK